MATSLNSARLGERGLSLIEALVIVTVTALLALLLLPLLSRATGRNQVIAENTLTAAEASGAERVFRTLLQSAVQQPDAVVEFEGRADRIAFSPALPGATSCASAGAAEQVLIRIVENGEDRRLVCEAGSHRQTLLNWRGEGRFTFSDEGNGWARAWVLRPPAPGASSVATHTAPLVRLEIDPRGAASLVWVERAGWAEPVQQSADAP